MTEFMPFTKRHLPYTLKAIGNSIYTVISPLSITAWRTKEPVSYEHRMSGEKLELQIGDKWGNLFDCAWFFFSGEVPEAGDSRSIVLLLDVDGEMCVFDDKGVPIRGLTTVASSFDSSLGSPGKRILPITESASTGEKIEVWADAGCNDLFGRLHDNGIVKQASIAIFNPDIKDLYYDFEVLLDSLNVLPENSPRAARINAALHKASHILWDGITEISVKEARAILADVLALQGGDPSLKISAIGHAHIDLGWLWPIRETHRKAARTFSTAVQNLELYPDYIFAASQAQLFQWLKEDHPTLYEKTKTKVKEGRIEPQGALWVECDTNLTSGESLIRQIMYGRRYFQEDFEVDLTYVWLPDTFGYSAALPQIMKRSGMKYFSTQKLSWSLINQFPYQSFHWQGIDGSQILIHMLPEETYNSPAAPRSVGKIEQNYFQKDVSDHALMVYGIGDGGGGPGEEHLERLKRLKNFAGLSPVKQEWTADFFEDWKRDADQFPTWVGELYLERHQGTLTTSARSKRFNRMMEQVIREIELTSAFSTLTSGSEYPQETLEIIWKEVLLYQFHDILPGSSIKRVYDESLARYETLISEAHALLEQQRAQLVRNIDTHNFEEPVVIFNSLSWPRQEWLKMDANWRQIEVPGMGFTTVEAKDVTNVSTQVSASDSHLENEILRVSFSPEGGINSILDKETDREYIPSGEIANQLAVFTDHGDAWDIPMDYTHSRPRFMILKNTESGTDGPVAFITQTYTIGNSTLTQKISLAAGSPLVTFDNRLTWRETGTMLRALFPVNIAAEEATFEIQFGHVRRPTHTNTTWDLAKDEVPAHKWIDLSQSDFGVSLLNDCKYGHRVKGSTLEINLLRSVLYPGTRVVFGEVEPGEPNHAYTDQAEHVFRYAIYPHQGNLSNCSVERVAYEFNIPVQLLNVPVQNGSLAPQTSFLEINSPDVIVETIKPAEDGIGLIIRIYEAKNSAAKSRIRFNFPVKAVSETNLLEEHERYLSLIDNGVDLVFHPFEIKTIRVV